MTTVVPPEGRPGPFPPTFVFLLSILTVVSWSPTDASAPAPVAVASMGPSNFVSDEVRGCPPEVATQQEDWPAARRQHSMVHQAALDRFVVFGGIVGPLEGRTIDPYRPTNETWVLEPYNRTWTLMRPIVSPGPRAGHAMAYHAASGLIVLFGGGDNETWAYDLGADTWTELRPTGSPPALTDHAMAYVPSSGRIILFGGAISETWSFDLLNNSWARLTPDQSPPAGHSLGQAMAYNAASGKVVLLTPWDGTWVFDPEFVTWTDMNPAVERPTRHWPNLVDHTSDGRLVSFGGDTGLHGDAFVAPPTLLHWNDTWAYDVARNEWTDLRPAQNPGGRRGHATAYHPPSGMIFLFSGALGLCPYLDNELWTYDLIGNAWASTAHAIVPTAPLGLFPDGASGRVKLAWLAPRQQGASPIMGYRVHWVEYDNWSIPLPGWAHIDVGFAYRFVHEGRTNGKGYVYSVSAVNGWGEGPPSCYALGIARGYPRPPANVTAVAGDSEVRLAWDVAIPPGDTAPYRYDVYRGLDPANLTFLATTTEATYRDRNVTNGVTYYYRIVTVTGIEESEPSIVAAATPGVAMWPYVLLASGLGAAVAGSVAFLLIRRSRGRLGPKQGT